MFRSQVLFKRLDFDIFQINGDKYQLEVDYFPKWIEATKIIKYFVYICIFQKLYFRTKTHYSNLKNLIILLWVFKRFQFSEIS